MAISQYKCHTLKYENFVLSYCLGCLNSILDLGGIYCTVFLCHCHSLTMCLNVLSYMSLLLYFLF